MQWLVYLQLTHNCFCLHFLTFASKLCRFEEYFDYLFPEETQTTNLKILEAAYKWKKQKVAGDED